MTGKTTGDRKHRCIRGLKFLALLPYVGYHNLLHGNPSNIKYSVI